MKVLVVNCGSSSLKAQLMETETAEVFANAYCERVGINGSFMTYKKNGEKHVIEHEMPTHTDAFKLLISTLLSKDLGVISSLDEIKAVGHRAVNFGEQYTKSMLITKELIPELEKTMHFAPLHNPAIMQGIKACFEVMPDKKNVAVFDIGFHATMPEKAYMYAIPYEYYENHKVRRYGAHGTSHRYIAKTLGEMVGGLEGKKVICCHIGSGSSVCAIKDGKSIDTSMGFTPLAGLVMGSRSGDIDPAIVKTIMDIEKCSVDEAINILNKKSGLFGLTGGLTDMRDIDANLDKPKVKLAFDMLVYSIKKYIGAYAAAMNGVDYIVFTAGIGEKDELVREAVCSDMEYLGIILDKEKNVKQNKPFGDVLEITKPESKVKVLRIPTDEEFMIALDTAEIVK